MEQGPEAGLGTEAVADFTRITAPDFVVGILHQLAKRSHNQKFRFDSRDRKLHAAFKASFDQLYEQADSRGQYLDFHIIPDQVHGVSQTVADELLGVGYLDPISRHHGSYVDLIYDATHPIAEWLEEHISGTPELYADLATTFSEAYEASQTTS